MKLTTIEAIRAHEFVGNFYSDSPAFDAIHAFADDLTNPVHLRAEALRIVAHAGMGLEGEMAGDHLSDEQFLAEYEESKE